MAEPAYSKKLLCLANSRKPGGNCVAGKVISGTAYKEWIRPVGQRASHEIWNSEETYKDGKQLQLLDIASISLIGTQPNIHQTENHIIEGSTWTKMGEGTWDEVVKATDTVKGPLWHNGDSSYHGTNDKVSEAIAKTLKDSLFLVNPQKLSLVVGSESKFFGGSERRVRASFTLNDMMYNFVVTDPWIEQKYYGLGDGTYPIKISRLCISLPELLNGNATKLVAAVVTPEEIKERR